jgi:hypothetical protein
VVVWFRFAPFKKGMKNDWFLHFVMRLLQGSQPVLQLLERNPFPEGPPKFIKSVLYDYHFSDWGSRDWWQAKEVGKYTDICFLQDNQLVILR